MKVNDLVSLTHQTAKDKGWHDKARSVGEEIALMHSELSEALEEFRKGHLADSVYYSAGSEKPEGVPVKLADCLIRIFDFCGKHQIDLEEILNIKLKYNETRSYRHGDKVI